MKPAALYFSLLVAVLADEPISRVQYRASSQSNINAVPFHHISRNSKDDQYLISLKQRAPMAVRKSETARPLTSNQRSTKADISTNRLVARTITPPKNVSPSLWRRSPMQTASQSTVSVKQRVAELDKQVKEFETANKMKQAQALQTKERAKTPARARSNLQVATAGTLQHGLSLLGASPPMPLSVTTPSSPRVPIIGSILTGTSPPRPPSPAGTSSPRISPPRTSSPRTTPPRVSSPRTSSSRTSPPRTSSPRTSPPRTSPPRTSSPRTSSPRTSPLRESSSRASKTRAHGSDAPRLSLMSSTGSSESYKTTQSSSSNRVGGSSAQEQPVQPKTVQQQLVQQQLVPQSTSQQSVAQQQPSQQSVTREQSLTRSQSLPLVTHLQSGQRVPGEMSASQPPSPMERQWSITSPQAPTRRVTVSDSPSEMIVGNRRQTVERTHARSSLPLRSALKGSNNNLAGMATRPLVPLPRENPLPFVNPVAPHTGPALRNSNSDPPRSMNQASRSNIAGKSSQGTRSAPADTRLQPVTPNSVPSILQPQTPHSAAGPSAGRRPKRNDTPNPSVRSGERGRTREPMSSSLSRGLGDVAIENERHPGKLLTTGVGTILSGGIVGGILTGVNYHSVGSIVGGSLAGSCVGLTGFVGACYYWKNARTTVEREQIPPEVRQNRGRETAAAMVPGFARNSYNYWATRSARNGAQNRGTNNNPNPNISQNPNINQNQRPAPSVTEPPASPFELHPDPNHPENLVRRHLANSLEGF